MNTKTFILILVFLGTGGFIIWSGHQGHVVGILPYLLLLACPLMHVLMHSGHTEHKHDQNRPHDPHTK